MIRFYTNAIIGADTPRRVIRCKSKIMNCKTMSDYVKRALLNIADTRIAEIKSAA